MTNTFVRPGAFTRTGQVHTRASHTRLAGTPRAQSWESPSDFPSLVPHTLVEMSEDEELMRLHADVLERGQLALTEEEDELRQETLDRLGVASFAETCSQAGVAPLQRSTAKILQLNIGLYCNQACRHCHVESSPKRTELMSHEVAKRCVELLDKSRTVETLDLTGGAPELCPEFAYLVKEATARGVQVIDRCNLTVLVEPGQEGLAKFLAEHKVRVVASLPCYSKENVDSQRGGGVFARSIRGLQMLNEVGYGVPGSGLQLDLVYNPGGPSLAPAASTLEGPYKQELQECYGITFNDLLCLNNVPIKRWADELVRLGKLEEYMQLLVDSFNPAAAGEGLMCRSTVSVSWNGTVSDCDFNQQLGLVVSGPAKTVFDLESLEELTDNKIIVRSHCFGCTAGNGSSCQGSTIVE